MRKITSEAIDALLSGRTYKKDNTEVVVDGCRSLLKLHGNTIVRRTLGIGWQDTSITTAGWDTTTTKERLNGLPGVYVNHSDKQLYLNGLKWDGERVTVEDWGKEDD